MLKKTITYVDFNGKEKTEDYYFHIGSSEVVKLKAAGFFDAFTEITTSLDDENFAKLVEVIEQIIEKSFGVKTEDGGFDKDDKTAYNRFKKSEAYDKFFMELITNESSVMSFLKGVFPADMIANLEEKVAAAMKERKDATDKH